MAAPRHGMSGRVKIYLDNDVILKLAACDLLDSFLSALGVDPEMVRVTAQAKFQIPGCRRKREKIDRYGTDGLERAASFIGSIQSMEESEPRALRANALAVNPGIDDGEALLAAAAAALEESNLVTGDKRFIRALAAAEDAEDIRRALRGRMICLEQAVLLCIDHVGFTEVRRRVVPVLGCDNTLRAAFGSGERAEEDTVRSTLVEYIRHLANDVGPLLRHIDTSGKGMLE